MPGPDPTVRPYEPRDRARVLELAKDPRAIDSPGPRIIVAEASAALALWVRPDAGDEGELGPVIAPAGDRRLFYRLVERACRQAIDEGLERGTFTLSDERLLRLLQREFRIEPQASGWEPATGRPVRWDVHVDLRDALRQLQEVLRG